MLSRVVLFGFGTLLLAPVQVAADAPILQSGTPVVHLADNLDEKDRLGWCIDTVGRGFSESLHAHSCKPARPEAQDTQFSYNADTGQIQSVAFEGKCMTLNTPEDEKVPFGLLDCVSGDASQVFVLDSQSMEIRPGNDSAACVAVGAEGRSAGPFMSRDLVLAECAATDAAYKQWVVVE